MYALVADVERYPEFLPWCKTARITKRFEDGSFLAVLEVGQGFIKERFTSKVVLPKPPQRIEVEYLDGPMRYLSNHWTFAPSDAGGCTVDFYVDFEFRNPLFQKMMGLFFNEIVRRMVGAFETRAKSLYR